MKKLVFFVLVAMAAFSQKVNGGVLSAGIKIPAGVGVYWNHDTYLFFSQFGVGGYHELKYKFIGFEMDYMYERDGDVASENFPKSDIFKLNIYGKLIGGPYYISVGPEFAWDEIWDGETFLSFVLGYNMEIANGLNLISEFPKVSTSFWDKNYKYVEVQFRIGIGISLF
jgi:hypothetical protein